MCVCVCVYIYIETNTAVTRICSGIRYISSNAATCCIHSDARLVLCTMQVILVFVPLLISK